eukprot:scaffold9305_cov91-Isochrysis_galbana.AAC.2
MRRAVGRASGARLGSWGGGRPGVHGTSEPLSHPHTCTREHSSGANTGDGVTLLYLLRTHCFNAALTLSGPRRYFALFRSVLC